MVVRLLLVVALALVACRGTSRPAKQPSAEQERLVAVAVPESELGRTIERLLAEPAPANRLGLLAGVVASQLARAQRMFAAGHDEAGAAALDGAFFLMQGGDFRLQMVQAQQSVLLSAANAAAHAGREGRALALYTMLDQILSPGPQRNDVRGHLSALAQWRQVAVDRGGLIALGAWQRTALPQVLYRPTADTYRVAREATLRWLDAARRTYGDRRGPPQSYAEMEEREEAELARQRGVYTLSALALRQGDFEGLLETLEDPSVAPSVQPRLVDVLSQAIEDGEAEAWLALWEQMDELGGEASELGELSRAAAFRIGVELYRLEPESIAAAAPISGLLIAHGMADVVPLLFVRSLAEESDARALAWVLRQTAQALMGLESIDDFQTARLTFSNAKPLLQMAEKGPADVRSSLATLQHVMGAMEVRAGELDRARPHLIEAARLEPTLETLRLLAAVHRQQMRAGEALEVLARMVSLSAKEPLALAEAQLLRHEVLREQPAAQNQAEAQQALDAALRAVLSARARNAQGAQADGERVLARILEHYGDLAGARRASERAFEAARSDPGGLTTLVLDTVRRALTLADPQSARQAIHLIDDHLEDDELAYAAVWMFLLDVQLKRTPDGAVREALARAARGDGWPARLASWALKRVSNDELLGFAKSKVEVAEARFYLAMAAWVRGDQKAALAGLQQVAGGEAVELIEVTIARDLLSQHGGWRKPPLPKDVDVP